MNIASSGVLCDFGVPKETVLWQTPCGFLVCSVAMEWNYMLLQFPRHQLFQRNISCSRNHRAMRSHNKSPADKTPRFVNSSAKKCALLSTVALVFEVQRKADIAAVGCDSQAKYVDTLYNVGSWLVDRSGIVSSFSKIIQDLCNWLRVSLLCQVFFRYFFQLFVFCLYIFFCFSSFFIFNLIDR